MAPIDRCFDLARSVDLHAETSYLISGKAVAGRIKGLSDHNDVTKWSAKFFGIRFYLTTSILDFCKPEYFTDVMISGLFRHFGHRYKFETDSDGYCTMIDELSFESPFGAVGSIFDKHVLKTRMHKLLLSRSEQIKDVAESNRWQRYLQTS